VKKAGWISKATNMVDNEIPIGSRMKGNIMRSNMVKKVRNRGIGPEGNHNQKKWNIHTWGGVEKHWSACDRQTDNAANGSKEFKFKEKVSRPTKQQK